MARRYGMEAAFFQVEIRGACSRASIRKKSEKAGKLHHKDEVKIRMHGIHSIEPAHGMMQEVEEQGISFFLAYGFIDDLIQEQHDGTLYHIVRDRCERRVVIYLRGILESAVILMIHFHFQQRHGLQ